MDCKVTDFLPFFSFFFSFSLHGMEKIMRSVRGKEIEASVVPANLVILISMLGIAESNHAQR